MKQTIKNNFLAEVLEIKKNEIKHKKPVIKSRNNKYKKTGLFYKEINKCIDSKKIFLIAEIKLASPTEGNLGSDRDIIKRARIYENAGANAISFITDKTYFKGDIKHISKIKKAVGIPVLQKDFVIDESQIIEAYNAGSDALLLIAKILTSEQLAHFVDMCKKLGIEPVVEINDQSDLEKAMQTKTQIIAVNSRNLSDLSVDTKSALQLLKKIPEKYIKLAFSGIKSYTDVAEYADSGAVGILVGTSIMKSGNTERFLHSLKFRNDVKVKICGIKNLREAMDAINCGADIIGFNFAKTSKRHIAPNAAGEIIKKIRGIVLTAAIFQNQTTKEIKNITDKLRPDFVQLHGEENTEFIKSLKIKPVIKSINELETKHNYECDYLLLDRKIQGAGKMFDLEKAKKMAADYKIFFAGGLTAENVAEVVRKIRPYGIDIAGGVETNGKKDKKKMKDFIQRVKGVIV